MQTPTQNAESFSELKNTKIEKSHTKKSLRAHDYSANKLSRSEKSPSLKK